MKRSVGVKRACVLGLALEAAACQITGGPQAPRPLQAAFVNVAEAGDVALVERFLAADPQLIHATAPRTSVFAPTTPLAAAAKAGKAEVVKLLLDRGTSADATGFNTQGKAEATAMLLAAQEGHTAILQLLLERGAQVGARDPDGDSALHLAARRGEVEAMQLLIARGADKNAGNGRGRTPLHEAASAWKLASVATLCAAQADTQRHDEDGHTAYQDAEASLASERPHAAERSREWIAAGVSSVAFLKAGGGCAQLGERVARQGRQTSEQIQLFAHEFGCTQDDSDACSRAGRAYDDALGVPRDTARARALFARGCALGDGWGCSREGWFYLAGEGVAEDDRHGAELYAKACGLDYMFACGRLGEFYSKGNGVPRDLAKARELLKRACESRQKDEQACKSLGKLDGGGV